ncbi:hypothetical protein [Kitasatospora indigofera]|uniref:hypothetical protein n=1 Tax=Kitasatospora indigofera TaxID=67307 RepID=UPI0033B09EE9
MRQASIQGVSPRRARSFTRRDPSDDITPDLVQRDFTADAPNRLWVAEISLIPTGEGAPAHDPVGERVANVASHHGRACLPRVCI